MSFSAPPRTSDSEFPHFEPSQTAHQLDPADKFLQLNGFYIQQFGDKAGNELIQGFARR